MISALALFVTLAAAGTSAPPNAAAGAAAPHSSATPHAGSTAMAPASAPAVPAPADTSETRVILVRHADKNMDWVGDDPPLSAAGRERAHALAHVLRDAHVDVIYSTYFLRARATAESVAVMAGDSVEVVDQAHAEALAQRVWSADRGRTVLIVGHSDTVPEIVRALCPLAPADLGTLSYDRLFIVTRRGGDAPHLIQLRYGAP
jgi:phosphohistidine phosphatase SixA